MTSRASAVSWERKNRPGRGHGHARLQGGGPAPGLEGRLGGGELGARVDAGRLRLGAAHHGRAEPPLGGEAHDVRQVVLPARVVASDLSGERHHRGGIGHHHARVAQGDGALLGAGGWSGDDGRGCGHAERRRSTDALATHRIVAGAVRARGPGRRSERDAGCDVGPADGERCAARSERAARHGRTSRPERPARRVRAARPSGPDRLSGARALAAGPGTRRAAVAGARSARGDRDGVAVAA